MSPTVNRILAFDAASGGLITLDRPRPTPGSHEVIVRVHLAGVCGTDAHRLAGHVPTRADRPIAFGHEGVGVVEQLGNAVATDWAGRPLSAGDTVYWFPGAGCRRCYNCNVRQDTGACTSRLWPHAADADGPAAYQRYAAVSPHVPVFRLDDPAAAAAVIALGCGLPTALGGFARLELRVPPRTVLVQGAGPVGLAAVLAARLHGAERVVVIGASQRRLDAALTLGATDVVPLGTTGHVRDLLGPQGADVIVEAAGRIEAFHEGLGLLSHHTRYLVLGLYSGTAVAAVDPVRLNNLNARVVGSLGSGPREQYETVRLAGRPEYRDRLAALVTHRFPLAALAAAIEVMASGAAVKAVVEP